MPPRTRLSLLTMTRSSAKKLSVVQCTRHLVEAVEPWRSRCASLAGKSRVISRCHQAILRPRNTIGASFTGGTSVKVVYLQGAKSCFWRPTLWERYSWQIALMHHSYLLQGGLIRPCYTSNRRASTCESGRPGSAWRSLHMSTASRPQRTHRLNCSRNQPSRWSILTNAETVQAILKSPSPDIVELKEIIDDIVRDDRRASEVIRRMKSLLTKAPFELKSLDLNDVARETVEFLSTLAVARKVELISLIKQNALPILGDHIQLHRSF